MIKFKTKRLLLITALLLSSFTAFAADRIEVIQLQGRSADEIISIIQPLLEPSVGLSSQGYKLIIRGSEKDIAQAREIISQLDSAPKQLTISLRYGGGSTYNRNGISASGTIKSGDVQASVNGSGPASVRLHETRRSINDDSIRRINVIEGRQAFIQTGQLLPVGQSRTDQFGNKSKSVSYKNINSGFYVVPRLSGEFVNLELLQNRTSIDRHGRQTFNTQRTGTTLRGRLGEWISIGGISQQSTQSGSGILHSTRRNSNVDSQLHIKVDVVPN
ncbi:MAG: hypothetical protein KAT25_09960 [Sulfuriflexus sp.]|nr:hypothetical protein [Sulfuriflexus sp.]